MNYVALHNDALVIDCHNDTIATHMLAGQLSLERGLRHAEERHWRMPTSLLAHAQPCPGEGFVQINLPLMRKAGIDAAFFSIDVTPAVKNWLTLALNVFGYMFHDLGESQSDAVIVRRAEDIVSAKAAGRPAMIMAIENADGTEASLFVLRALYELGVRSIGLTHHISSCAGDGCAEAREGVGLTHFGVKLVREMNRLGMLVDIAHASDSTFFSALDISSKPVICSHANARAVCDHPRNLSDDQLKALAANGGVIGLTYVPAFVDGEKPTLERVLDHAVHVAEVAGVDALALGSDFDGGGTVLTNAGEVPLITEGLLRRGFGEAEVRKVLGGNVLRVLRKTIG